jgi:hypothetical protein
MPKSQYDSPPLLESKEDFREYILKLHQDVYGLGNDITGSLNVEDNLVETIMDSTADYDITGLWNFVTHPTGLDHLQIANIGTNTHVQIDAHIASIANPHSVTVTQAIIEDSNTTDELLTWTSNGIVLNDNVPLEIGTTGTGALFTSDGSIMEIDLATGTIDYNIKTTGNANALYIDESAGYIGVGLTPSTNLDLLGSFKLGDTRADTTQKSAFMSMPNYNIALADAVIFRARFGTLVGSDSSLDFGGGVAVNIPMRKINFYTGSDTTTTGAGTLMMQFSDESIVEINPNKGNVNFKYSGNTTDDIIIFDAGNESMDLLTDVPITFGTGRRSTILNDGTNILIDPDTVGSGRLLINNRDVKSMALMVR